MDQVFMKFEADYDVVLECIQEVYGLEFDNLRFEKDFLEKADILQKPYCRKISLSEQNTCV